MQTDYAGFWRRSLAVLLDNLVWIFFYLKQRLGDKAAKTVVVRRAPRVAKERTV
jgi:uncharacterized RDD family membrane protein YckC